MNINSIPNSHSENCNEGASDVAHCMAELEREVWTWLDTYQAWDERKHPAILQFVRDIREHCADLGSPGAITSSVISMELHRLGKKLNNPEVAARIAELQHALLIYTYN